MDWAPATGKPRAADDLRGFSLMSLGFVAQWPLSLVLSPHAIERYQLLFRHVLFARHVERAVCQGWTAHQASKELGLRDILGPSMALRHRMTHFTRNVTFYMLCEVIDPRWHEMAERMATAATVDEMQACHDAFLETCLHECLLTSSRRILHLLTRTLLACYVFSSSLTAMLDNCRLSDDELDRRAGFNKASKRQHMEEEQGDYGFIDQDGDDDDARSVSSRTSHFLAKRRPSLMAMSHVVGSDKKGVLKDRERRNARIAIQTAAMREKMVADGFGDHIQKASAQFTTLMVQLIVALREATRGDISSHLAHFVDRLDADEYYSRSYAPLMAAEMAKAQAETAVSTSHIGAH